MNKIYKVVWSKVKNCYVVVSEIAKNVISGSVKSAKVGTVPLSRGLALGSMMAFVITGNIWAEGKTYNNYLLPRGEFNSVSAVIDESVDENTGKVFLYNAKSSNKIISNPDAYTVDNPNYLKTTGEFTIGSSESTSSLWLYAGYAVSEKTKGEADNNKLEIIHNFTSYNNMELYGAILAYGANKDKENAEVLTISGNTISIYGITLKTVNDGQYVMINGALTQGHYNNKINENYVKLENVIFDTDRVMIAGAQARDGVSLERNKVEVINTNVANGYITGAVGHQNDDIVVNQNDVIIDGTSKISCDVFGGYNISGIANGNSINIKGGADVSEARLYGDNGGEGTGNTLNLETGWSGAVGSAQNFNIINIGEGVDATFNTPIVANEQNTIINIGKDDGEDVSEEGIKESLLIGQIVTKETGTSSLNFINGGAWKVTGKSNVSDVQGDTITINVDKVEKDLITINNGVSDEQKVILNVSDDDLGVDVTAGVQTLVDTVVDGSGKSVFERIADKEIDLKATVDATVSENGSVQNVITTIKPGDTFVVESDVEVVGDVVASYGDRNISLIDTSERLSDEISAREVADAVLDAAISSEIASRIENDNQLQATIAAEVTERVANDIASGVIDSQSGQISLAKNNGETIMVDGVICDSRLESVAYDDTTGKMTFSIKDHYSNDTENSIVVSDIASKTALDEEIERSKLVDAQLFKNDQEFDARINQLGSKMNKVGAGAAALAALHPMDFDSDDKLSFAAGVGNYSGENATALGMFYRPNEKVMISAAGTMGNGENMVNMGVSFALDKTNNVSNSRVAMAREIVDLREHVARQEQALAKQDQQIAQLVAMVNQLTGNAMQYEVSKDAMFPDIPENHWAYEYINGLAAKGIVEGYPDGTFGGDRTMTRYEFAAMLFKAMQRGAVLSDVIKEEFKAELGRIRVERVKGDDSNANKTERVRVNNYKDRDDYGSKVVAR